MSRPFQHPLEGDDAQRWRLKMNDGVTVWADRSKVLDRIDTAFTGSLGQHL
ncbi:MAG: hypothetical protein ACR2JB_04315 [Bryobacteraceae bacterium]